MFKAECYAINFFLLALTVNSDSYPYCLIFIKPFTSSIYSNLLHNLCPVKSIDLAFLH